MVALTARLTPQYNGTRGLNGEQDWQCTYNVTLRRVRLTIVAVENKKN
jgi:hypothetical protein